MSLTQQIRTEMFNASKAGDVSKSEILKMALASIKNQEISKGEELTEDEVLKIIRKETKKIEDSITEYSKMGREDLVQTEKKQLEVLSVYLPSLMTQEQIEEVVKNKIEQLGAKDMRDMGKVMGVVMKELDGQADGNVVKNIVQKNLSK